MTSIEQRYESFVDNFIEEEFSDKENTSGLHKSARKAELMQKLDNVMLTFIEEIEQSRS